MVTDLSTPQDEGNDRSGDQAGLSGSGSEKTCPTTAVRYGCLGCIGEFTHPPNMKFGHDQKVIIKTDRGIELGEQIALTDPARNESVSGELIRQYVCNSGPEYCQAESGRILRQATPDDLREEAHLRAGTTEKLVFCQAIADRLNLPLKVVACEHLFGGERIIFYFLAEGRVDFRALVKETAVEYQTRIEMRQVGVRDEARLLADYETCGRECCCKTFLKTLRPVSMKMAKMQKATLDPSKVSGRCGRLKCCLRYEHVAYDELDRRLPKIGAQVSTPHGEGVVVNRQILTQLLQVRMDEDEDALFTVAIEDILGAGGGSPGRVDQQPPSAAPVTEPGERATEAPEAPDDADTGDAPTGEAAPTDDKTVAADSAKDPSTRRRRRRRRRKRKPDGSNDVKGNGGLPGER